MKYFLGLDVALTNNGICLIDENAKIIKTEVFIPKSNIIEERISEIINNINSFVEDYNPLIYLEGLSYGSRGRSFSEICGVHYSIRCFFYNKSNIVIIEPTKLKKFITGKGQCKKELILLYVYKKFGEEFDNNNIADAYGLARMALENNKIIEE
jgi:crossover junction endodeoxyribonuclease RuvC